MPVEGLPKTMETLLSSLIQGNALLSWQIYQDKVGNVHMNIKFSGESVTHDQASVSYRRKPPAQVKRDRRRAETFRTTVVDKSTPCLETHVNPRPGVQTRRMAAINRHDSDSIASDIEVMRHEQSLSSELDILASPFVPGAQQMISLEDRVYVPTVHSSPDTASPDVLTDPNMDQDSTTTCTETETQHSMDITTIDMDSGEETDREDMSPQVGRCGCARCDHGGAPISKVDTCGSGHYRCDKCSVNNCVSWICHWCYEHDGHKRHRKYMTLQE